MLDRLAILGNINVGNHTTKNSPNIHEIWKAHDVGLKSVKNSDLKLNKIELSDLDSSITQEEMKDSLDRALEISHNRIASQRYKKLHNQRSYFSNVESSDSFLEDTVHLKNKLTGGKPKSKVKRKRRNNHSVIPKTIENALLKKISQVNPSFDDAFKYYDKDIHELAEDPTIKKKIEHMSEFASPSFLMGLKKKQRMQEYWKSRVRKDFTQLDKSDDENNNSKDSGCDTGKNKLISLSPTLRKNTRSKKA